MSEPVLIEGRGTPVWTLTLNTPESRNAIDEVLQPALLEGVLEAAHDPDIRSLVITGAGSVFSAGADFGLIRRMQTDLVLRQETFELSRELFRAVITLAFRWWEQSTVRRSVLAVRWRSCVTSSW